MPNLQQEKQDIFALRDSPFKAERLAGLVEQLRFVDPEEARSLAERCLDITEQFDLRKLKVEILNYIAVTYSVQSHFSAGLLYFTKAHTAAQSIQDRELELKLLTNLGILYFSQGDYSQSLEKHLEAIKLAEILDKKYTWANNHVSIANVYFTIGEKNRALKMYEKALEVAKTINSLDKFGYLYYNIGSIYKERQEYDKARIFFEKVIPFLEKRVNNYELCIVYNGLAELDKDVRDYQRAISFFRKALELGRKHKIIKQVCHTLANISDFMFKVEEAAVGKEKINVWLSNIGYKSTIAVWEEALHLAISNDYIVYQKALLALGIKWYKKRGDVEKAFDLQESYITVQEKLFEKEKGNELIKLKSQFELNQKETQISIQEKQIKQEQSTNSMLKKLNASISSQRIALKQMNEKLQKEIEERKKIEKELVTRNEELQQFAYITAHNLREPIANIVGLLQLYDKENPAIPFNLTIIENLEKASFNIDSLVKDLYQIVAAKSKLVDKKVEIKLDTFTEKIKQSIIAIIRKTDAIIEVDFSKVDTIISIESYLANIFHNLIVNAIKYRQEGRRPHIKISTYGKRNDMVGIMVQDNGMGIDLGKNSDKLFGLFNRFHNHVKGTGLGLYLVKSQVDALGGSIGVTSKVGEGTIFRLMFNQRFDSDQTGK